jgi:hypothetical protein
VAQGISCWLSTMVVGFHPRSGHMGFVVDEVTLERIFFKNFCFPS